MLFVQTAFSYPWYNSNLYLTDMCNACTTDTIHFYIRCKSFFCNIFFLQRLAINWYFAVSTWSVPRCVFYNSNTLPYRSNRHGFVVLAIIVMYRDSPWNCVEHTVWRGEVGNLQPIVNLQVVTWATPVTTLATKLEHHLFPITCSASVHGAYSLFILYA